MKGENALFDRHAGYRKLHSFTFATMIHIETISFCKRFIPWKEDQLGKTSGQMIGAARSGRQNIIEGSERSSTSKSTEITLTDVARGSLAELQGDYEIYLADRCIIPWSKENPERKRFGSLILPVFQSNTDTIHEYWKYYHEVKMPFSYWLQNEDSVVVANAMIILIQKTMAMLKKQIEYLGGEFLETGGFRERMYQLRNDQKNKNSHMPSCPECGKEMRQRNSQRGTFLGCSGYPECKGTRDFEK